MPLAGRRIASGMQKARRGRSSQRASMHSRLIPGRSCAPAQSYQVDPPIVWPVPGLIIPYAAADPKPTAGPGKARRTWIRELVPGEGCGTRWSPDQHTGKLVPGT